MSAFDKTLGSMLIGVLLATFLQGVLTLQIYYYFTHSRKDSWMLKGVVLLAWSLDVIHLVLISHGLYHYTVSNWGNVQALPLSTWQLDTHVAVTGLVSFVCQMYFLRRLYILSGASLFLIAWPLLMALGSFALDIVITATIIRIPEFAEFAKTTPEAIGTWSLTAATDAVIALMLCYYLHRQRTTFTRTQRVVRKVIQYTITTGLFTSIIAIVSLVLFVLFETSFVFFTTYFSLGSLYTNSLLASLNMRQALREDDVERRPISMMSEFTLSRSTEGRAIMGGVQVKVSTSMITANDRGDAIPSPRPDSSKSDIATGEAV